MFALTKSRVCQKTPFLLALAALTSLPIAAHAAVGGFIQTNLVSTNATIPAAFHDGNLVNAWGITQTPTSPFWVADNGSGFSTLYTGAGVAQALVVTVPGVGGNPGTPTGVVSNPNAGTFLLGGAQARFIFATEDGLISGWNGSGTVAINAVTTQGAVYKGVTLGSTGGSNFLYAANFNAGTIDVFNSSFAPATLTGNFNFPALPAGFAPFNIQNLGGNLYVTYAMQDAAKHDDVPGPGHGFVAEFNTNGTFMQTIASAGTLDSPWGIALAPANFGSASGDLLVGNFGDGTISVFNPTTNAFLGHLQDPNNNTLAIDGLWGLSFGNGTANGGQTNTLYFTAGPADESLGLFGSLTAPEPASVGLLFLGTTALLARRRRA